MLALVLNYLWTSSQISKKYLVNASDFMTSHRRVFLATPNRLIHHHGNCPGNVDICYRKLYTLRAMVRGVQASRYGDKDFFLYLNDCS